MPCRLRSSSEVGHIFCAENVRRDCERQLHLLAERPRRNLHHRVSATPAALVSVPDCLRRSWPTSLKRRGRVETAERSQDLNTRWISVDELPGIRFYRSDLAFRLRRRIHSLYDVEG